MASTIKRPVATGLAILVAVVIGLLVWVVQGGSQTARPAMTLAATVDRFNGPGAFALLRAQVLEYGWRPAGSPALRQLAVRLRRLMPNGRFEPIPGHAGLRNIVGTVPGRLPAIVVGAHYDVEAEPSGFVGANDGAAGTAAVVTLARAFARTPRPRAARALRFVLFDGEEEPAGCTPFDACGLRGSTAYALRHAGDVSAMILLDYIAEKRGLSFPREANSDRALWSRLRRAGERDRPRCALLRHDIGTDSRRPHPVPRARRAGDRPDRLRLSAARLARGRPRRGLAAQPRRRRRGRPPARDAAARRPLTRGRALSEARRRRALPRLL